MFLDIETTGLNANSGMLIAIGMILPNKEEKIIFVEEPRKEKECIKEFLEIVKKFKDEEWIVWYSKFDIPFLVTRCIKHGIDASILYELKFIDLCKLFQEHLKFSSNKLDEVSRFFGIEKKLELTGRDMQLLYLQFLKGDRKAKQTIISHCLDDLKALEKVYEKVKPYLKFWLNKNSRFI